MQFDYFYSYFSSSSSSYSSWLSSAKVKLDLDYSALFVVMLALLICLTIELVVGTYSKVLFIIFRFDNDIFINSLLREWTYSCSSISFSSPYYTIYAGKSDIFIIYLLIKLASIEDDTVSSFIIGIIFFGRYTLAAFLIPYWYAFSTAFSHF